MPGGVSCSEFEFVRCSGVLAGDASLSGLAIRKPPKLCERLKSFSMARPSQHAAAGLERYVTLGYLMSTVMLFQGPKQAQTVARLVLASLGT